MDTAAFAKWLAGIGLLVSTQRGQAFRALALAEAIDPIEWSDTRSMTRRRTVRPGEVPRVARPRHTKAGRAAVSHQQRESLPRPSREWMRRFHGVATKNLPSYLSWRRTIEALSTASAPEAWIMGAAGLGPYQQGSR